MTARDVRYGRRGGGWLTVLAGDDVCHTCRNSTARHVAHIDGESWPVCTRCRDQGLRLCPHITYTPLDAEGAA